MNVTDQRALQPTLKFAYVFFWFHSSASDSSLVGDASRISNMHTASATREDKHGGCTHMQEAFLNVDDVSLSASPARSWSSAALKHRCAAFARAGREASAA